MGSNLLVSGRIFPSGQEMTWVFCMKNKCSATEQWPMPWKANYPGLLLNIVSMDKSVLSISIYNLAYFSSTIFLRDVLVSRNSALYSV